MKQTLLSISLFLIALSACVDSKKSQRKSVMEFVGRQVVIPEGLEVHLGAGDEPLSNYDGYDYKIITVVDSTNCTTCKMKLSYWGKLINQYNACKNVDFLMVVITSELNEIKQQLLISDFRLPVCIDSTGLFVNANGLSTKDDYTTMLLDADNNIVAIGNPVNNPKIRKLYSELINGSDSDYIDNSQVVIPEPTIMHGGFHVNDTILQNYDIINSNDFSLTIDEIVPSCDCISITVSPKNLNPGESDVIQLQYIVSDSTPGLINNYADVFFYEIDQPTRLTLKGYIVNP